jgi:hypothetical protein
MSAVVGLFRVRRGFMVGMTPQAVGSEIELSDGDLIAMLLDTGRIEPADDKTARMVGIRETVTWSEPREPSNAPMLPAFVGMPARR